MTALGKAIAIAAKFANKGTGKVWIVGQPQRGVVLARRGLCTFAISTRSAPLGVLAIQSSAAHELRGTLALLDEVETRVSEKPSMLRLFGPEGHADLPLLDHRDVPMTPSLASTTIRRLEPLEVALLARVAEAAATEREDRPGLEWVQIGPLRMAASDEVVITSAPSPVGFAVRIPGYAVEAVLSVSRESLGVAELGPRQSAIYLGEDHLAPSAVVAVDRCDEWFPDLPKCIAKACAPEARHWSINRAEIAKALRAAKAGLDEDTVLLGFEPDGIWIRGGDAHVHVSAVATNPIGPGVVLGDVYVSAKALLVALAKGPTRIDLAHRGPRAAIEISDVSGFQAIVYPKIQNGA